MAARSAAAVFGETVGPLRLAGMALVLLGLASIVRPGVQLRPAAGGPVATPRRP